METSWEAKGGAAANQDKPGTIDSISGMTSSILQRIVETRAPAGASACYANADLMRAAQDLAWRLQGHSQRAVPADAVFAAQFGYRGEDVRVLTFEWSYGTPEAPADPSVLITQIAFASPDALALLRDRKWNEVGAAVYGSCYGLACVVILGDRLHAPGPNP